MSDNKKKVGKPDREHVATSQPYEISYFAKKHGISAEDARRIVKQHGGDRDAADNAANRLKR
ncbi:DUF3606 domain-containing protein [Mycoplana sp. MJR14]|jgi:hypothetical protein|uniref:DUF3606 domain-containing protein n=1 Tax=Mycoplana sp. MJR14 TaxID=3032583 RepID=UPI0011D0BB1C|nr:DUF3606 domain-containing protein [Mycoplana sp. MJR14]MDF1631128.1 DUF3606 domain-containing protein [Mycoplana sp. MJR14]